jgi:hypothetical protein
VPKRDAALSGLSEQQRDIFARIARLEPEGVKETGYVGRWGRTPAGTAGYYYASMLLPDGYEKLPPRERRVVSASLARAVTRLERRGLVLRHDYSDPQKHSPARFFTLTKAGLVAVNELRRLNGDPPLAVKSYPEEPRVTREEFIQRLSETGTRGAMVNPMIDGSKVNRRLEAAKEACAKLTAEEWAELVLWREAGP